MPLLHRCFPFLLAWIGLATLASPAHGDETADARRLTELGAKVTVLKGIVTGCDVPDPTKLSTADLQAIGRFTHLKTLSFGLGLTDEGLAQLPALGELESFGTNGMKVTDDGVKPLARCLKLQSIAFFHPGKGFSGTGLTHLAGLPDLQRLTVAGSPVFGDEGMAAVARLPHLKNFRTWHTGVTNAGVRKLITLKNLESLTLGQRLASAPPACPSDETPALLAACTSLKVLDLQEARLSYPALVGLKPLTGLKTLKLTGVEIPDADVARLKSEFPKVAITMTLPSEANTKRIKALFGK